MFNVNYKDTRTMSTPFLYPPKTLENPPPPPIPPKTSENLLVFEHILHLFLVRLLLNFNRLSFQIEINGSISVKETKQRFELI